MDRGHQRPQGSEWWAVSAVLVCSLHLIPTCTWLRRPSHLRFPVCIANEWFAAVQLKQPGPNEPKLHSQNRFSAGMENRPEQLSRAIASYLPGRTQCYGPFCQLHEICSQKPWKQKNHRKAFYPLIIYIYQHCCRIRY